MRSVGSICAFLALVTAAHAAFRLEPAHEIEIIGNKFFNSSSGLQFFIRGVAYQRTRKLGEIYDAETETAYVDSLASPGLCLKDLEFLKELGVNTVRVYQVDPRLNHDVCMNAFASHGIYVLVDLSEPQLSINQRLPSWDVELLRRYTDVVDSMHSYTNLLGFIAGNEVLNKVENSAAAAFAKGSVRDIKAHIRNKNYRRIPVGYASADDTITRIDSASYFVCTDTSLDAAVVDFYALNMFEWCGYSSYATSGYKERTAEFSNLPVPVFFSEYGCNAVRPRPFTEIDQIYGPVMTRVWSGAVAYEFFQNENRYGLVDENAAGHVFKLEDFNIVKLRLLESMPRGVHRDEAPPLPPAARPCPEISDSWNALSVLPPAPDPGLCECLQAALTCVVTPYIRVDLPELLAEVCSKTDCLEIAADGSRGIYGKYSGCSMAQRASYALDRYYVDKHRRPEHCDFGKRAALTTTRLVEGGILR
ncbi:hypothetical protein METBIDRAFT_78756 [Metschnikowia bicuspidata var. bicuspidata NRRL YB-4993]|uniref:1,3-beta-glucanosyltransferase n=1 Tax=Metschnikowia bicuspidata var. bicuspidata NRRL YB-4993 TaxID=869754 RepID=A0A1A0H8M3_9ASCO|nr:hypothetical protein METBIDRAFT_78756 [Metschnikowia bicuspidata var. bicuspidata NRRL YB-4993]OBA20345.1 hypothetical protein METBIDRAFT_78756 [Metschnikowia bicuspidata var. bicuspidata NRRL YB-4993]